MSKTALLTLVVLSLLAFGPVSESLNRWTLCYEVPSYAMPGLAGLSCCIASRFQGIAAAMPNDYSIRSNSWVKIEVKVPCQAIRELT